MEKTISNILYGSSMSFLQTPLDADANKSKSVDKDAAGEANKTKSDVKDAAGEAKPPLTNTNETKSDDEDATCEGKPPPYNKRVLSLTAKTYNLELFEKNLMIIFNQIDTAGCRKRKGTKWDVLELHSVFTKYGFDVKVYNDRSRDQIFQILDDHDNTDFTNYGAIAVVILTHGGCGGQLYAKSVLDVYSEVDILQRLSTSRKPTLFSKPKLLFIQACRGDENTRGVVVSPHMDHPVMNMSYYWPLEEDTFVFHSSYIGKPSIRIPQRGSWFIQTLCKKICEHARTDDFVTICREVQREVACLYYDLYTGIEVTNEEIDELDPARYHKQMPTFRSSLFRKLFLKRRS